MTRPKVSISYDKRADVLYVTLSDPSKRLYPEASEPSFCQEFSDDILVERGVHSGLISGFRVLGFRKYRGGRITVAPLLNVFKAILFENTEAAKRAAERRSRIVDIALGAIEDKLTALAK